MIWKNGLNFLRHGEPSSSLSGMQGVDAKLTSPIAFKKMFSSPKRTRSVVSGEFNLANGVHFTTCSLQETIKQWQVR